MRLSRIPKGVKRIPIPIYGGYLHLVRSLKVVRAWDKQIHGGDEAWGSNAYEAFARTERGLIGYGGVLRVLFIPQYEPGLVAHECAHVVFRLFGDVGIPIKEGRGNEAFCYLLQELVETITKLVKR